jgi:hypothetical protein
VTEPSEEERAAEARWLAWEREVKDHAVVLAQLPDAHLIGDARLAARKVCIYEPGGAARIR